MRRPKRFRRKVRIHMVNREQSFEGVLLGRIAGHYRLANAEIVGETGTYIIDGEQWIPRERVLFVQVLS